MPPAKRQRIVQPSALIQQSLPTTPPSKTSPEIIDLTDSPSPKRHSKFDTIETKGLSEDLRYVVAVIGTVLFQQLVSAMLELGKQLPEAERLLNQRLCNRGITGMGDYSEELRSATVDVCSQLPEAARLLRPLLDHPPPNPFNLLYVETPQELEKKRKREMEPEEDDGDSSDGEICENCGEKADDDGDGCCQYRVMQYYQRQADEEELEMLDSDGDVCGECGGDINDDCCKAGMMREARKWELQLELSI